MATVALDIGHGNNTFPPDKGVYKNGKGYAEHDFNSKLVQAIDPLLRKHGIKTIIYQKPYARDVHLTTRTNYYNRNKVDLVYSIHANANGNPAVNGRCVFYWHTSSKGKQLANIIAGEIKKAGYSTHGNGLHASERGSWTNLHICRETNMPAVLVENGFMTGDKDFDLVFGSKQAAYIDDMAQVHTRAICRYFGINYTGIASKPAPPKKEELTVAQAKKLQEQINQLKKELANKENKPKDVEVVSKWAKEEWDRAVYGGYFDGSKPKAPITKEQTSKVVNKLVDNLREYDIDPLKERVEKLENYEEDEIMRQRSRGK